MFGFSKRFNGIGIYVNNILSAGDGMNYIVGSYNDGTQLVNPMKLTSDKEDPDNLRKRNYCAAKTRNRPDDKPLYLRITHLSHTTSVKVEVARNDDPEATNSPDGEIPFYTCFELPIALEAADHGNWLISAGTGLNNPDSVRVTKFWMHDLNQKIDEDSDYNELIHERHEDDAKHVMEKYMYNMKGDVAALLHDDAKQSVATMDE